MLVERYCTKSERGREKKIENCPWRISERIVVATGVYGTRRCALSVDETCVRILKKKVRPTIYFELLYIFFIPPATELKTCACVGSPG